MQVGVISDTHGLLRPQALEALTGMERILHAGDIGNASVLEQLGRLAPVVAVRGNNDHGSWSDALPELITLELGGHRVRMIHDLKELQPADWAEVSVIVAGHSHRPLVEERNGVLVINPGSAGPRRFRLPVTVARLVVEPGRSPQATLVPLDI